MYMTLEDAQAIDCNRCGDCCDSRRARTLSATRWWWGKREIGDDRIVELREALPGALEDALPVIRAPRIGEFRCPEFVAVSVEEGTCVAHDRERPQACGDFPVFGEYAESIREAVARDGVYRVSAPTRCSWYAVRIVAGPGE